MSHDDVRNQPRFRMYDDDDGHKSLFEAFVSHTAKDLGPIDENWFFKERASQISKCSQFGSSSSVSSNPCTPVTSSCLSRNENETPASSTNTPASICQRNASFLEWTPLSPSPVVPSAFKTPRVPKSFPQTLAITKNTPSPLWSPSLETPPLRTARSKQDLKVFAPRNLFHPPRKSRQSLSSENEDNLEDENSKTFYLTEKRTLTRYCGSKKDVPLRKLEMQSNDLGAEDSFQKHVEGCCEIPQVDSTHRGQNYVKVTPKRRGSPDASRSRDVGARIEKRANFVNPYDRTARIKHHLKENGTPHIHVPDMTVIPNQAPSLCQPKEFLRPNSKLENVSAVSSVVLRTAVTSPHTVAGTDSSPRSKLFSSTSKEFSFSEDKSDGVFERAELSLTQMFEVAESTIACIEAADMGFTQCMSSGSEAVLASDPGSITNDAKSKTREGEDNQSPGMQLPPLCSRATHGSQLALSVKRNKDFNYIDVNDKPHTMGATARNVTISSGFKTRPGKLESSLSSAKAMPAMCDEAINYKNMEPLKASSVGSSANHCDRGNRQEPAYIQQTGDMTAQPCSEARSKQPSKESVGNPAPVLSYAGGNSVKDSNVTLMKPRAQPGAIISGFVTARGKPVYVQEQALNLAHKFLADGPTTLVQPVTNDSNVPTFFTTGMGKTVTVSVDSLKQSKREHGSFKSGFTTAGGKPVYVQEDGIDRARQFLSEAGWNTPGEELATDSLPLLPTGGDGKTMKAFGDSVTKPKCQSGTVTSGFITAGGKPVHVQEEALSHSKQLFAEASSDLPQKLQPSSFRTGTRKAVTASVDSLEKSKEQHGSLKSGFKTAAGKALYIQEEGLNHARCLLRDDICRVPGEKSQENAVSTPLAGSEEKVAKDRVNSKTKPTAQPGTLTSGFATAGGKPVYVQKKSLGHSKQLFAEAPSDLPKKLQPSSFTTGTRKAVTVSVDSLEKSKEQHSSLKSGFKTAAGKAVYIQEEGLSHACHLLRDDICGVPSEKSQENAVFTPLAGCAENVAKDRMNSQTKLTAQPGTLASGFATAGGKPVYVQEEALTRARQLSSECPTASSRAVVQDNRVPTLFTTGTGKAVTVSVDSLANSKEQHSSLTSGFASSEGEPVHVKEESVSHAHQLRSEAHTNVDDRISQQNAIPTFFTTGSGKKLQVSAESLKAAEVLFDKKRDGLLTAPAEANSKENKVPTRPANPENSCHVLTSFKTGSEKAVSVSKKSLSSARTTLNVDGTDTSSGGGLHGSDRRSDPAVLSGGESNRKPPALVSIMSDGTKKTQESFEPNQKLLNQDAKNSTPSTDKGHSAVDTGTHQVPSEKRTPASAPGRFSHAGTPMFTSKMKSASKTSFVTPFKAVVLGKAQTPKAAPIIICGPRTLFVDKSIRPGKLWILRRVMKATRLSLRDTLQGQHPKFYSLDQLKGYGVLDSTTTINSLNAADFVFYISSSNPLLILGDGATMQLESTEAYLGKDEFSSAFFKMPGVNTTLVPKGWLENHYRWIVWKLASMELHCPQVFGGRSLTPDQVMLQLKYRYDIEIDNSCRSALRKIYERDDVPSKTLVLCVSALEHKGDGAVQLELTDGWYSIRAELDEPLLRLASTGRLFVGLKLLTSGAELVGSAEACTPLEASSDAALKLSYNSTRRARWDARLGYYAQPKPFPVSLASLHPKGGLVGRVDCLVIRAYPVMYLEMLPNKMGVMRHEKEELIVAAKHEKVRTAFIEKMTAEVLSQVEKSDTEELRLSGIRLSYSVKQIQGLNSGRDIWKAIKNSSDPTEIERLLSEEQLRMLRCFQEEQLCSRQAIIQQKLESALQTAYEENKCPRERVVIPVLKVLLGGLHEADLRKNICCLMCVWRPTDDTREMLKQGEALSIYNINVTCSRQVLPDIQNSAVELTTTKMTQFEPAKCPDHVRIYYMRQVTSFPVLLTESGSQGRAVDIVGFVLRVSHQKEGTVLTLTDTRFNFVQLVVSRKAWAAEESMNGKFLSATDVTLRTGSADRIATLETTEFSVLTTSPASSSLRHALSALKASIKNPSDFATTALARLQKPVHVNSPHVAPRPPCAPQQTTRLASPATPNNTAPVGEPAPISRTPTETRPSDDTDGLSLPKGKTEVEPGSPADALSKQIHAKIEFLQRYAALAPIPVLPSPPSAKAKAAFRSVKKQP
nr:LOW QUALITY PROTEIN: breast cancer type 2 susceptibility protein homolog [Rhipicephalus microplus]